MSDKVEIKRRKTYGLRLTKFELLHLRDLFSVLLPPEGQRTMSQALAELESRTLVESVLWKKVSTACVEAGLPMDDDAPDYVVAPASPPPMSVFQLSSDPAAEHPVSNSAEEDEDDE